MDWCWRSSDNINMTSVGFKKWKRLHFYAVVIFFCFCFCFCFCFFGVYSANSQQLSETKFMFKADNYFQNAERTNKWEMGKGVSNGRRLLLGGPGSSPPRCNYKCGKCTPCKAVHVAVPPRGMRVTAEYYPEAWRCECGNRLYMP
ncbi:hypothetical protein ABFX02_04G082400 [Erythranthe guttata]